MRAIRLIVAAVGLLLACGGAMARASDRETCEHGTAPDQIVAACTRVLSSGSFLSNADRATELSNRGSAYFNKGDYEKTIADENEAIRLKPDLPMAFSNRGAAYMNKRDYDRAIADENEAIRLKPDFALAFNNRGAVYLIKGDYDKTIADENEAIRLKPDLALAFNNRGAAFLRKGDYERAIADESQAIRLGPELAGAFNVRGYAYFQMRQYDRAIEEFNAAIRLKPSLVEAFSNRGGAYHRKGDYDRAIADYSEVIRLKPDSAQTFGYRGDASLNKGEYAGAIADYSEAIRLKPDFAQAYNGRGDAHVVKGEYDLAIADENEAIRLKPDFAEAFKNRGWAYVNKNNFDQAVTDAEQALRLDPHLANPHAVKSRAYLGKGDMQRALAEAEQALALDPNYMGGWVTHGEAEAKAGNYQKALDDFDRALAAGGTDRIASWVDAAKADRNRAITALSTVAQTGSSTDAKPLAPPPAAPRRVALIVANAAYHDASLANPTVDADLVKASLERVGFKVAVKSNLALDAFEQAIDEFADQAKGADVALFYFAGHGFSIAADGRQQNLLMATDADFQARTALALQRGGERLEHVEETIIGHARATLFFVDACRNIPANAIRAVAGGRGFAPIDASAFDGAFVVVSTRQGKTAQDGIAGKGSPFARAFADVLPTPRLRIEDVYARIREKVRAETQGEQAPDLIRSDLPEGGLTLVGGPG